MTVELIRETIKKTSLDHCVKVLSKNKLREKDNEEQKIKEENHKRIMCNENKDEYELDEDLYNKVLKTAWAALLHSFYPHRRRHCHRNDCAHTQ